MNIAGAAEALQRGDKLLGGGAIPSCHHGDWLYRHRRRHRDSSRGQEGGAERQTDNLHAALLPRFGSAFQRHPEEVVLVGVFHYDAHDVASV